MTALTESDVRRIVRDEITAYDKKWIGGISHGVTANAGTSVKDALEQLRDGLAEATALLASEPVDPRVESFDGGSLGNDEFGHDLDGVTEVVPVAVPLEFSGSGDVRQVEIVSDLAHGDSPSVEPLTVEGGTR